MVTRVSVMVTRVISPEEAPEEEAQCHKCSGGKKKRVVLLLLPNEGGGTMSNNI
jgi:hypothetical protein